MGIGFAAAKLIPAQGLPVRVIGVLLVALAGGLFCVAFVQARRYPEALRVPRFERAARLVA